MAFLIGGANSDSAAYQIDNSLKFNRGGSSKLGITPGSAGNRKIYTISFWIKRSDVSAQQNIFGTASEGDTLYFDGGDKLRFFQNGSSSSYLGTNRLFRDPAAWYHIVLAVDTNQGTAANRVKLYINGSQYTWDASTTYPAEDYEGDFNNTADEHMIGNGHHGNYFDGYLADFYFIDGTQYAASTFGETNDNGVWVPIKASPTFGTNGFFMEFQQTGTSANASGMGADTSGNDNHLTPTNLTAEDVTTDTPTNNFCTLNPLNPTESNASFSEGNLRFTNALNSSPHHALANGTMAVANGKWYWEVKVDDVGGTAMSIGAIEVTEFAKNDFTGDNGVGYFNNGNFHYRGTEDSDPNTYTTNDIIGVALDMDNRAIYFHKNGTYEDSGDPTSGSSRTGAAGGTLHASNVTMVPAVSNYDSGACNVNFGNPAFSISSGNADANGYGNFEYAVPSGYYALCTKNLAEFV